jgi:hypothetical protein
MKETAGGILRDLNLRVEKNHHAKLAWTLSVMGWRIGVRDPVWDV